MKFRVLGSTDWRVSELSFGAGPVAALMTDKENAPLQRQTIQRALETGLNWFDTAPTYGAGQSESNLGAALADLGTPSNVGVATKVRLLPEQLGNIKETVKSSVAESLRRLRRPRIALIQLHNSVTQRRGDQPTSITPPDVLGRGGVLEAFAELKADGLVEHFGLTGLGDTDALAEVIRSGPWAAIQACDNILHPRRLRLEFAAEQIPAPDQSFTTADTKQRSVYSVAQIFNLLYRRIVSCRTAAESERPDRADAQPIANRRYGRVQLCATEKGPSNIQKRRLGVIAIRVLAGGALAGQPPSAHTLTTQFFPLAIYRQDQERAARLAKAIPASLSLQELAIRYVLSDAEVATALIGFASPAQIDEAVRFAEAGPLDGQLIHSLLSAAEIE